MVGPYPAPVAARRFKYGSEPTPGVLAIAGGKGGCGKTTTALGLARALARRGREPLVLDADCDMPDLHHVAGTERRHGVDALARGAPLDRVVQHPTAVPGVSLVTAGRAGRTDAALRATCEWDGPVLVDCPAGVGPDATRPLRHADGTLVVSTDERQCLEDTGRTVTTAEALDAPPVGALLRRVGAQTGRHERVAGCRVLGTVPSVADPLDAPALARVWSHIADTLIDGPRSNRHTATGTTDRGQSYDDRRRRPAGSGRHHRVGR